MNCEKCGKEYPSRYWFHGHREVSPLICNNCEPPGTILAAPESAGKTGGGFPILMWSLAGVIIGAAIPYIIILQRPFQMQGPGGPGLGFIALIVVIRQLAVVAVGALIGAFVGYFVGCWRHRDE